MVTLAIERVDGLPTLIVKGTERCEVYTVLVRARVWVRQDDPDDPDVGHWSDQA